MWTADAIARARASLDPQRWSEAVARGDLGGAVVVTESASTNVDLVAAVRRDRSPWPHLSVLAADFQTAGLGRAGRTWVTPPGTALTMSVVVDTARCGDGASGWVPLAVGCAVSRVLRGLGVDAGLKWPNDVVIRGAASMDDWGPWRKCVGVLCEMVPEAGVVVAGIGINVAMEAQDLPVAHATSLALAGAEPVTRDELAVLVVREMDAVLSAWSAEGLPSLAAQVHQSCVTMGQQVNVSRSGAPDITGMAQSLDADGALVVVGSDGAKHRVHAGDVKVRRQ